MTRQEWLIDMPFLRKWFPPKSEIWRPFAEEVGGQYVEGSFWTPDRVEFTHAGNVQMLTAESDSETNHWSTCVRSPIETPHDIMIGVMKKWPGQKLFDLLASFGGLQKISLAQLQIEGDGTLLSRDIDAVKLLFAAPEVRAAIAEQTQLLLFIGRLPRFSSARGEKGPELLLSVPYIVDDKKQVSSLLQLHKRLLDSLIATKLASTRSHS